ncbi:MAG: biotin/lipoyl-binding protein [Gammaproteobacteria bacterium]
MRQLFFPPRGVQGKARLRLLLLIGGPLLVLIIGGYLYVTGGRYVSSEDAYVQATRVNVAAEVAGRVVAVPAAENQPVHAQELLFRIDDSNYRLALQRATAHLQSMRNSIDALRAQYREKQAQLARRNSPRPRKTSPTSPASLRDAASWPPVTPCRRAIWTRLVISSTRPSCGHGRSTARSLRCGPNSAVSRSCPPTGNLSTWRHWRPVIRPHWT